MKRISKVLVLALFISLPLAGNNQLLQYPPELRELLAQLLTKKFNLASVGLISEPMGQAKVIGSDITVEEIVEHADALVASLEPEKIPGKSNVKFITLDDNQKMKVDKILRFLEAINKALLTYYEGPQPFSGKRVESPGNPSSTDDPGNIPPKL